MSDTRKPSLLSKLKRRLGAKNADLEQTIETVIDTHAEATGETTLDGDARSMMRNVIGFADIRVKDLMVPRANITALDEDGSMRELLSLFIEANHSRVPIFRESLDDVIGMVHVKDFLRLERVLVQADDSPLANLYLSMLDAFGTPVERFADSTGRLAGLLKDPS